MYRIRFHGRGGQGMKTASRILGSAFFHQGYEVQDAPRYGAERRGAPVSSYVRASLNRINERGVIHSPDLVVVADESLFITVPAALTEGTGPGGIMLVITGRGKEELEASAGGINIITIPYTSSLHSADLSTICASASARLTGAISAASLERAMEDELGSLDDTALEENMALAGSVYDRMAPYEGSVTGSPDIPPIQPGPLAWIELPLHDPFKAAPSIHASATSALNITGSWRTLRPEIISGKCSGCMICRLYCPDSAINAGKDGLPSVDYGHCKGCMICASVCPVHAIEKVKEHKTV